MDPDIKKILIENLEITKQNNELLTKIRSVQKWSQITRAVYWLLIIGASLGSYYFIQPYLGSILNVYSGGVSDIHSISDFSKNLPDSKKLQDIVNQFNQ